jgi:hypothetical protein
MPLHSGGGFGLPWNDGRLKGFIAFKKYFQQLTNKK